MPRGRPRIPDHLRPRTIILRVRPDLLVRINSAAIAAQMTRSEWILSTLSHATAPINPHTSDTRAAE
jgi:hypothetical protein